MTASGRSDGGATRNLNVVPKGFVGLGNVVGCQIFFGVLVIICGNSNSNATKNVSAGIVMQ